MSFESIRTAISRSQKLKAVKLFSNQGSYAEIRQIRLGKDIICIVYYYYFRPALTMFTPKVLFMESRMKQQMTRVVRQTFFLLLFR